MRRVLLTVAALLFAVPAAAQESGQVGVAVGYPSAIGVIWHVSDNVALRPDFTFSRTGAESVSPSTGETSSWSVGFGISGMFYTGKVRDDVRLYVTPRFAYSRGQANSETEGAFPHASDSDSDAFTYSGAFGVQYSPVRRFSVFAEAGVQYLTAESTSTATSTSPFSSSVATSKTNQSAFGLRTAIGVVLYFN